MNNKKHSQTLLRAIATVGLSSLSVSSVFAASYVFVPGGTDWNTPATWVLNSGSPGSTVADSATISGAFGGVSQSVDISTTPVNAIAALTLGDTTGLGSTTLSASGGSFLTLANNAAITSTGTAGAVNSITAPISLAGGFSIATVATPNALSISGKITPTLGASRTIDNLSARTLTLGDIDISTGATTGVTLSINVGGTAAATSNSNVVLNGVIADGGSVATNLSLGTRPPGGAAGVASGSIQINGTNLYTGNTVLGRQANSVSLFLINSDQPFGPANTGSLTIGNNSYVNRLQAVGTDRVITKGSMTINKSVAFEGTNSLALSATTINMSGSVSTGNATLGNYAFVTNNIVADGKTVTLGAAAGNLYLNASNNSDMFRMRNVEGAGTTIIHSNISDNFAGSGNTTPTSADSRMVIQQGGTGTLILTGNNTYQGSTRITAAGTIQLGNGGTSGSLAPAHGLAPIVNSTAAGTLAFNRSDAVATTLTANGPVGLAQRGLGAVTLSNTQFNSGANVVGDGLTPSTLVVNGAAVPAVSTTGANIANFANGQLATNTVTLTGGATTTSLNLKVGQPVYLTGSPSSVAYIDSMLTATTFRVGGLQTSSSVGPLATASNVGLTFGEGSALGTSAATTTVNTGSRLVINGSLLSGAAVTIASGAGFTYNSATPFTGTLTNNGGTISGSGPLNVDLGLNSLDDHLAPGNSPGVQSLGSNQSWSSFTYDWEVNDFTGTIAGTAFDQVAITGNLDLTGGSGSYVLNVLSLTAGDASGLVPNFSETDRSWTIASTTAGITGFNAANWTVDAAGFLNSEGGIFNLELLGNDLVLSYVAVPEPSTYAALVGLGALGLAAYRRRRS